MMHKLFLLSFCLILAACGHVPTGSYQREAPDAVANYNKAKKIDRVVVKKSQNKLYLMKGNYPYKEYDVALGKNPIGHKVQEGDHRTPEGRYYLNYKNDRSKFYRSINITYPNERDIARAKRRGVNPGDDIVLHGMPNELGNITTPITPKNWTQGCIAVRNHEIDEIWSLVALDTPIDIYP